MLPLIALLILPALVAATCPSDCTCLLQHSVHCKDEVVDRMPVIPSTVTELDLSDNRMASPVLERSNFTGLVNVEKLILKNCDITAIEYHTFADMVKLNTLDLTFNNINILPAGSLTGLNLLYLFFNNNPNLVLNDHSFRDMSVEVLALNQCGISQLRPGIFNHINTLRKIQLQGNRIERFPTEMLQVFQSVAQIRIQDNPLICDCESKWLKEFFDLNKDSSKVRDPSIRNQVPRCAAPSHVAGQFFDRLSVADFSCDKPTLHARVSFTDKKGTLRCESRGNPVPSVTWHRPNGVITEKIPHGNMAINTNEIELLADEPDVLGQYLCVASNDGGNISLSVNIDWPFRSGDTNVVPIKCKTETTDDKPREIDLTNTEASNSETNVFKTKIFTLVDIIGAILGTFVGTLIVTVLTLHFCVYRGKTATHYTTPAMSEYSSNSSNGSDKNGPYPMGLHSLQASQIQSQVHRPLPNKPYHKIYDENHYMATNVDERDEFLRLHGHHQSGRITPASSSCDTCPACRTMPHPHNSVS